MNLKYRKDIDGLRAIAVLAVIFFHTNVPGFSGGFVGVDIFFVISGFLITSIILNDIQEEKFSIVKFYERRIRRIFPALFPVIVFTLIVGAYLFYDDAFKELGRSITATTLFSSNILFWRESGYFDAQSLQKPLLHTWSLAVEEQFYILFPFSLVFVRRFLKSSYFQWVLITMFLSLGASILSVYVYQDATFYLLPTRAWELLAGSIIALRGLPNPSTAWQRNLLSITGMGLIVYSVGFYTDATLFPGTNAIAPVLGAGLIIYSSRGESTAIISKLLSLRPLVFIGLISYSLYLWHWPFVVFTKYVMFRSFSGYESAFIILLSLLVATLSWKFIEQPFRVKNSLIPDRKILFVISGIVMIIISGIGGFIDYQKGLAWRFSEINPAKIARLSSTPPISWEKMDKLSEGLMNGNNPFIIGSKKISPSFVLWGDSHAFVLINAVAEKCRQYGLSGYIISHSGSKPLLGIKNPGLGILHSFNQAEYSRSVIDFIRAHPEVKTIVMVGYWSYKEPMLKSGIIKAVNTLLGLGCNVVIVSDVPVLKATPERFMFVSKRLGMVPLFEKISPTYSEYKELNKYALNVFDDLAKYDKVTIIHPESLLFNKEKNAKVMINNKVLYLDEHHLSVYGAQYIAPAFDEVFKQMAVQKCVAISK